MKNTFDTRIGSLRQFQILLTVYEQGSIKKASEILCLTQPTISMQLKKLSDTTELPLYDLVGRKIVFTQSGLAMVKTANEII